MDYFVNNVTKATSWFLPLPPAPGEAVEPIDVGPPKKRRRAENLGSYFTTAPSHTEEEELQNMDLLEGKSEPEEESKDCHKDDEKLEANVFAL